MPSLVCDLGGTHLRYGIACGVKIHGIVKHRVETFLDGLTPEVIADRIAGRIETYIAGVSGIGAREPIIMAFPGPIEKRRFVIAAPTLYGNTDGRLPDIVGDLNSRTGRDVHLLNDMSAAAWGLSAQTEARRFMVVTVSSGIGSKVFDRGNPMGVIDDPPFAGEIGHYVVDPSPDAIRCDCGGLGHLGGVASGRAIERRARQIRGNSALTNESDIVPAIRRGDSWAIDILKQATEPLARTLLAVTMAIGLDKVFIIGGFAQGIGPTYTGLLNGLITANSRYQILEGRLDNFAELVSADEELCLTGAAFYAARLGLPA